MSSLKATFMPGGEEEAGVENQIVRFGRGVGNTTRQMQVAPKNAVFVWVNGHLEYARDLAAHLGRTDLKIVSPAWLTQREWAGRELSGIVLDHACRLDRDQRKELERARPMIRGAT